MSDTNWLKIVTFYIGQLKLLNIVTILQLHKLDVCTGVHCSFSPWSQCAPGTTKISSNTCSVLTVNPRMVMGKVAEKSSTCLSEGRKEMSLSSAFW